MNRQYRVRETAGPESWFESFENALAYARWLESFHAHGVRVERAEDGRRWDPEVKSWVEK